MKAEDLVGVKFVEGGRDLGGADCLGIAILEAKRLGRYLADPGRNTVERVRSGRLGAHTLVPSGWKPVRGDLEPGDFLLLEQDGVACHCAVVRDSRTAVQSNDTVGRSHVVRLSALLPHLDSAWRLPAC